MAETIGSLIREWLRANNLEQKVQETSVPDYWVEIVGESVARQTEVERIDKGRMFVRVANAVWRKELSMRREEIRAKVNERFGTEIIKEIILR